MPDNSELRLVTNRYGGLSLDKIACRGGMCTYLEVTVVISEKDHVEKCPNKNSKALNMIKLTIKKKRNFDKSNTLQRQPVKFRFATTNKIHHNDNQ
ncbi:hypothetical protein T11_5812 [Trichinella zimbabwensis]|uniref:Uncharacterized protein n=1 Tax=Trichinella zimbabwensis TaxID=268475 RepID=A0A0V1I3E9_9BILA|nr:hypothetical protein T11_5812 [Trichinella zimbabwensis]